MKCFDGATGAWYAEHEEYVEADQSKKLKTPHGLGYCGRCGDIVDEKCCKRLAARGHLGCKEALAVAAGVSKWEQAKVVEAAELRAKQTNQAKEAWKKGLFHAGADSFRALLGDDLARRAEVAGLLAEGGARI